MVASHATIRTTKVLNSALEHTTVHMLRPTVKTDVTPVTTPANDAEEVILEEDEPEVTTSPSYSDEDVLWLARVITAECGCEWMSDEQQLLTGNVVLNRIDSPEFPDTLLEVIFQPSAYAPAAKSDFRTLQPTERARANAIRLLDGERFCPKTVVFQANFKQGSEVYKSIYDPYLGTTTYFCISSYPHLYD